MQVESDRAIRVAARTGQVPPAHCTSAGKALLAALPETELSHLCGGTRLAAKTSRSMRSLRALETALDGVRRDGLATNHEGSEEGVGSVAVALLNGAERPVAAVAVAMPEFRLTPKLEASLVRSLTAVRERFMAAAG